MYLPFFITIDYRLQNDICNHSFWFLESGPKECGGIYSSRHGSVENYTTTLKSDVIKSYMMNDAGNMINRHTIFFIEKSNEQKLSSCSILMDLMV